MSPLETNARKLIGVMVQYFPVGATCEDLRRQFEKDTSLARQSFYNALNYAKGQGWLVGGGKDRRDQYQLYTLNTDASWKEPVTSIGEGLEKDRLEHLANSQAVQIEEMKGEIECLREWSAGSDANGAGIAVAALVRIVADGNATARQKIKASSTILSYKTQDDAVVEFAKKYLQSVCGDLGVAVDYRIEASEALRRSEDPKLMPATERPPVRTDPAEPNPIPLRELVAQRREKYRMAQEAALMASLPARNANGGGNDPSGA